MIPYSHVEVRKLNKNTYSIKTDVKKLTVSEAVDKIYGTGASVRDRLSINPRIVSAAMRLH